MTRNRWAAAGPLGLALTVCACTVVVYSWRTAWATSLAATPDRVAEGRLWLLATSALYTSDPVVISLLGFAALAALAFAVCGVRVFWLVAAVGHLGSTLLVYVSLGLARIVEPGVFQGSVSSPDYGVSAMLWAWVGAVAWIAWSRRGRTRAGRAAIVASCAVFAIVAYVLHPDLTVLSAEHPVAFALGALVAAGRLHVRVHRPRGIRRLRLDPVTIVAVVVGVLLFAASAGAEAFGDIASRVAYVRHPSPATCADGWNRHGGTERLLVARSARAARIDVRREILRPRTAWRRRAKWADFCSFTYLTSSERTVSLLALWRHGRIARWERPTWPRLSPAANARVLPDGRIRLYGVRRSAR